VHREVVEFVLEYDHVHVVGETAQVLQVVAVADDDVVVQLLAFIENLFEQLCQALSLVGGVQLHTLLKRIFFGQHTLKLVRSVVHYLNGVFLVGSEFTGFK